MRETLARGEDVDESCMRMFLQVDKRLAMVLRQRYRIFVQIEAMCRQTSNGVVWICKKCTNQGKSKPEIHRPG